MMKQTKTTKEKKVQLNISPQEIRNIFKDYEFDDENPEYDDDFLKLLDAFNSLSNTEKIILELYAEFSNQRKVGQLLNVSKTIIAKELRNIRGKIFEKLYDNN